MPEIRRIESIEVQSAIARLADSIALRYREAPSPILLGIANGGIALARRLSQRLKYPHLGTIDVSFHRDDIAQNPIPKEFAPTLIPGDVNGAHVILVDDVLFSGRTVKASLDELFDHGRPDKVELAILVDRGGRKLPFTPDYCGLTLQTDPAEKVIVTLDPTDTTKDCILVRSAS